MVYSLPSLKLLLDVEFLALTDLRYYIVYSSSEGILITKNCSYFYASSIWRMVEGHIVFTISYVCMYVHILSGP